MPTIELTSDNTTNGTGQAVSAWLAEPAPGAPVRGGLVLIEEVWGVNDHITDIAGRLAAEGYVVIAPEILALGVDLEEAAELGRIRSHGTDEERHAIQPRFRELLAPTRSPEFARPAIAALRAAVDRLLSDDRVAGRVGVLGFCFGGTYSLALAAADDRLRAAVSWYGAPMDAEQLSTVTCPVLAFYGEEDEHVTASRPQVEGALGAIGVPFEGIVYPDAGHAFFNDTNPLAYRAEPAKDSWRRTLDFLAATLPDGR
ncbi:dienelactone hydrolase family protein [Tersicoccus sp. Bi-70]|uniref:dienelactone hydrolase family protein n=1 Tax=Tersicoccus sp. Bi-70 TaxID=1897634 RepID=UPI00097700ED|nr:dienelactone hydrolase family protein [Tersicoccus sp. Bi-70]OMH36596.1 hypothetical protein BGP79_12280 [Tersicoccus sp. Bi-70]